MCSPSCPPAKTHPSRASSCRPTAFSLEICPTFDALIEELRLGAAAILLPEEAMSLEHNTTLRDILAEQPPWSDLPVLILTKSGADSAALNEVLRTFGNVTLLERPVRGATLLSAVRTAIRSRERQYQIRGHLADGRAPKSPFASPTSARMNSLRHWVTSCAIRLPRC